MRCLRNSCIYKEQPIRPKNTTTFTELSVYQLKCFLLHRYNEVIQPNNGLNCRDNPNEEDIKIQVFQAQNF